MYSDLFSQKSVQDLLTVLPSLPLAVWETFYVTVVSRRCRWSSACPWACCWWWAKKTACCPSPAG